MEEINWTQEQMLEIGLKIILIGKFRLKQLQLGVLVMVQHLFITIFIFIAASLSIFF